MLWDAGVISQSNQMWSHRVLDMAEVGTILKWAVCVWPSVTAVINKDTLPGPGHYVNQIATAARECTSISGANRRG